jgi:hypothetical protein
VLPLTFERSVYNTLASEWAFGIATVKALIDPRAIVGATKHASPAPLYRLASLDLRTAETGFGSSLLSRGLLTYAPRLPVADVAPAFALRLAGPDDFTAPISEGARKRR